jgi:hypothetical protein
MLACEVYRALLESRSTDKDNLGLAGQVANFSSGDRSSRGLLFRVPPVWRHRIYLIEESSFRGEHYTAETSPTTWLRILEGIVITEFHGWRSKEVVP